MAFASLYAMGKFSQWDISLDQWHTSYSLYSLFMTFGSLGAVLRQHLQKELFLLEALVDFLTGWAVFKVLFWGVRTILVRGTVPQWLSLLPGLFLIYYGLRLRRGRQWRWVDLG